MREHETSAPSLVDWEANLEALSKAATQGKWLFEHMQGVSFAGLYSDDDTGSIIARFGGFEFAPRSDAETDANCALSAALVNAYREGRMARAADAEHYMHLATERAEIIRSHPTAMAEAVASARAEGWQPIETAPKDGTEIDLFTSTNRRFVDLYWDREQRGGGWAFCADRNEHWMDRRTMPCSFVTHWHLPPTPPTLIPGGSSDV